MIREFFEDSPVFSSLMAIIVLGLVFLLIDGIASKPYPFDGIVMDKQYKAEVNSTGTGYGIMSNGKSGMIITHQHEEEEFLLMVKTSNKEVVTVKCSAGLYYEKEIGQKIECNASKGFFTGKVLSMHGIR